MLDIAKYYNNAITKSAGNLLTFLLPASLPPTSLPPAFLLFAFLLPVFEPLISPPTAFKKFDYWHTFTSLKKQANRIAVQNVEYKIAFKLYVLAILF